jgi:predicted RNase H-like HicB family nuclease
MSIEKDEAGFYFGRCKELPNAFTQARTLGELKQRMSEVIDLILDDIEQEHAKNPRKIVEVVA